jgi:hypothetical protein
LRGKTTYSGYPILFLKENGTIRVCTVSKSVLASRAGSEERTDP